MSSRPASRRQTGRGAVQGAERSLSASVGRPEARGLRSLWPRRLRSERHERRLCGVDVRHLRRPVRRHDGGGRRGRQSSGRERGADLRYNLEITLEEAFRGKTATVRMPTSVACEGCWRLRRARRLEARDLQDLRRTWAGARATGLLRHRAHLPVLSRPRSDDRKPLRQMRRRRPRDQGAHAVGQCSRRRRGRHAHSPDRRGRGGNARRPGGGSLYFPHRQAARVLPARRRRPLLPRADLDGAGLARRRIQRPDARWNRVRGSASRKAPSRGVN